MKNEKELWIDKLMGVAATNDPEIKSRDDAFEKILNRIDGQKSKSSIVSFYQFKLAGVAAIAILALNIGVIAFSKVQNTPKEDARNDYGLSTYNLDLYQ